ncbi:FMN reductase [Demetria terragena]|uniref:FMN reductase n=1 Tax=Demetria terragena TaxID=63959 RepID=UPI00035CAF47|nr:FMN reductase [Demetria terragena]
MTRRIVALTAGLSTPSSTRLLTDQITDATRAAVSARGENAKVDVIELRELATDLAQMMTSGGRPSEALGRARDLVATSDGIVAVTPVFAASYSGLFKMFIDSLDPETIEGKPVLIAATAGTPRHSLVLEHAMRPLFSYLRALVVPTAVFAATADFGSVGSELGSRIHRGAAELAAQVVAEPTGVEGFTPGPGDRRPSQTDQDVTPFAELLRGRGR